MADLDFDKFYREFAPTLVRFLMSLGARLPDATDIAQETMIKAYRSWSTIDTPKTWVRTVAFREYARHNRSIKEDPIAQAPEREALLSSSLQVEEWESKHEILRALGSLPRRQREVMAWTLDGYKPAEIASELEITSDAVRASLKQARRALAKYLGLTEEG